MERRNYLTKSQTHKLNRLIYFLRNRQEFGCTIDEGDPENQALIMEIIEMVPASLPT